VSERRVLVIDDEAGLRHTLLLILRDEGYRVTVADDGESGLRTALAEQPDLILCDIRMPRMGGLDFLQRYQDGGGTGLVIMMSAYGALETAVEAMRRGAYDYISKPFNADEVQLTQRKAEEREQLRREVARLKREVGEVEGFEGVVGTSAAMREVMELAMRVAPFPSTVLLTGESGSGKEAVARAVHQASPRRDRGFVAVNCGAIPENLLESELFGHEKGAFTGAIGRRIGRFERASGGTLFLDEIGDMSLALQSKILRALQEREIERVGGSSAVAIDVRIVAATNRDLDEEIRRGGFRSDLFYRLNVITLHLPPLRERPDDVPLLATYFLERFSATRGRQVRLTPETLEAMQGYDWPGNVRELENALERAAVMTPGEEIGPGALPAKITERAPQPLVQASLPPNPTLEIIERAYIHWVLQAEGGNKTKAAEVLGIDPSTLYRKLLRYGMETAG
jgi:two-component system response regulator HydG